MEQPKIKNINFINTDNIEIDGDAWVRRNSFVTEIEHLINHVTLEIKGNHLHIIGNLCLRCGNLFEKQLTSHHTLPKAITPKYNVFLPLCKPCHLELNKLYKKYEKKWVEM